MATAIVKVVAPEKAALNQLVDVTVTVKNIGADGAYIVASAFFDGTQFLSPAPVWVNPQASQGFHGQFTMPSTNVTVAVYSAFWTGSAWFWDSYTEKLITLEEVEPVPGFSEFKLVDYIKV